MKKKASHLPVTRSGPSSIAELRTRIRTAGMRSTLARIAVLQALETAPTPVTHAELADTLVPQGYDKATVYRNLMDLTEARMVTCLELGDHVYRFELRRGSTDRGADHPHFLCIDCGKVACLDDVSVNISPAPGTKLSTISELTGVMLKGRCGVCRPEV
jgi:Fur family ferric uptake transcriptional regulator